MRKVSDVTGDEIKIDSSLLTEDIKTNDLINEINSILKANDFQRKIGLQYIQEYNQLRDTIIEGTDQILFTKAVGNLLNNVLDGRLSETIEFITNTINDALKRVFPRDPKILSMKIRSVRDTYPQLNVKLMTPGGEVKLKNQEGTGVKQIISVLYILCLVYISGGRRFICFDEVLDGLHEDAMIMMDDIFKIFIEDLDFTILCIEHGYPVQNKTTVYELTRQDLKSTIDRKVVY